MNRSIRRERECNESLRCKGRDKQSNVLERMRARGAGGLWESAKEG